MAGSGERIGTAIGELPIFTLLETDAIIAGLITIEEVVRSGYQLLTTTNYFAVHLAGNHRLLKTYELQKELQIGLTTRVVCQLVTASCHSE